MDLLEVITKFSTEFLQQEEIKNPEMVVAITELLKIEHDNLTG